MRKILNPALSLILVPSALPLTAHAFAAPAAASFSTAVAVNAPTVIALQGSDADGTPLTYATPGAPSHGTLSQLNTSTGAVIYTPTAGYTGSDSFTYTVTSGGDTTAAATVTVTVTSAKTRIIDTLTNPDGGARSGKVTFILTKAASSPSGIIPANATVSAVLTSVGQFDLSVYPSRAVSPIQYYQVWFEDAVTKNTQMLGVYDIPASATTISLTGRRVTNANLDAQYTFASKAEVDAVWAAAAAALTPAAIFPAVTSSSIPYWNGTAFVNSGLSQSGTTTTLTGNLTLTGGFTAAPDAPGYKVSGAQVVGGQGYAIPDPEYSTESNTEAIKQLLALLRGWGAVGTLKRSTLNDGLVSLWLLENANDAAAGNHLTNTGGVTFNSQGANFSGANYLSVADNSSLRIPYTQSFTVISRPRLSTKATSQTLMSKTDGASANEFALTYASAADGIDRFRFTLYPGGTSAVAVNADVAGSPSAGVDYLVAGWYDAFSNQACIAVNAGTPNCTSATNTAHPYTAPLALGRLTGVGALLNGSQRFAGLWSRVVTTEEQAELLANGGALTFPLKDDTTARAEHVLQPYDLLDNRATAYADSQPGGYFYGLPYARASYTTTATSVVIESYNSNNEAPPNARSLNVRVNGEDFALVEAPQSTGVKTTHPPLALPGGLKTVEVLNGFQYLSGGAVKGTWAHKLTFNAPAEKRTTVRTPKIIVYGDSNSAGAGATIPSRGGWTMLLRAAYPGSVAVEGWGGRSLAQDAPNGTARATLVQRLVTQCPDATGANCTIWLSVGTNCYGGPGFGEMSAATFGTTYAALLDDLHTARPGAVIIAQSPWPRLSEAANNYGNTLGDYRTQTSTACAARAWCTYINGGAVTGFTATIGADLFDTVHPNDSGHTKIFNYVSPYVGL